MAAELETVSCPFCAEQILPAAKKCKHCGEVLDPVLRRQQELAAAAAATAAAPVAPPVQRWSPGVAAVLSLVIPGAGQMYKGHIGTGLLWLVGTFIGYVLLIIPGAVAHICCIVNAYSGDPTVEGG